MTGKTHHKICLVPKLKGLGGTASFQAKLTGSLSTRGIEYTYDLRDPGVGVILVVGGTRRFRDLDLARQRGALIVQRLDGINWLHRRRYTGVRHFLRAEINNWIIAHIRRSIADRIVYQSRFVRRWWEERYGDPGKPAVIIHNGVDLGFYTPKGPGELPVDHFRLLLVEGRLGGGYHMGLENAAMLTGQLQHRHHLPVILRVVGEVPDRLKNQITEKNACEIEWMGVVSRREIPELDRSAHAFFSADLNAACPNAVIEALACGLPVVAFDTGALRELVTGGSGRIVPYGGNVWRLEPPDVSALADACVDVLKNNGKYRQAARTLAEKRFSLDEMVDRYCKTWDSI
ncbi:MAG: glycosyltransferase family 4 protein [Anaerolineaceae bacterium]